MYNAPESIITTPTVFPGAEAGICVEVEKAGGREERGGSKEREREREREVRERKKQVSFDVGDII